MRVACIVPYPAGRAPGQRFRLEQWAPHLSAQGIHLEFFPFFDAATHDVLYETGHVATKAMAIVRGSLGRLAWMLRTAKRFDAAVIHREALPFGTAWLETQVARRMPMVFDFDDAIWLPSVSEANQAFAWLKDSGKIDAILAQATAVSAGCEYLAEHARPLNPRVAVVPTSIDLVAYGRPRIHAPSDVLVVGWSGSVTTGPYLGLVAGALKRAAASFPMRLVVYGARFELPGVEVECIPWSAESEIEVLRTFDVGLKPTPCEEWVKGKCPMKDLQYMALGIPPVATRFGTTLESIDHGRSGFLCSTEDEWVEALTALQDDSLRARLGSAGRAQVEGLYSSVAAADKFARVLQGAVAAFPRGRESS